MGHLGVFMRLSFITIQYIALSFQIFWDQKFYKRVKLFFILVQVTIFQTFRILRQHFKRIATNKLRVFFYSKIWFNSMRSKYRLVKMKASSFNEPIREGVRNTVQWKFMMQHFQNLVTKLAMTIQYFMISLWQLCQKGLSIVLHSL